MCHLQDGSTFDFRQDWVRLCPVAKQIWWPECFSWNGELFQPIFRDNYTRIAQKVFEKRRDVAVVVNSWLFSIQSSFKWYDNVQPFLQENSACIFVNTTLSQPLLGDNNITTNILLPEKSIFSTTTWINY